MYITVQNEVRLKWPTCAHAYFYFKLFTFYHLYISKPNIKIDLYFFFISGYEICFYQSTDNQLH